MMEVTPELYDAIVRIVDQRVGEIKVTREDFDKLTAAVRELAEAQKKTEFEISAQGERITSLGAGVEETQKRTYEALRELAEGQKRTDQALRELAEAQKRTEESVRELVEAQKRTDQTVGRLTDTIGHDLESIARVSAPDWLEVHKGVRLPGLMRRIFRVDGEDVEVDLYGEGLKDRAPVTVVGEAKSAIYGRDVEAFSTRIDRLKGQLEGRIIKLMFGYWIHPSAEQEARKLQVHVIAPPATYTGPKPAQRRHTRQARTA